MDTINDILAALGAGESTVMWIVLVIAIVRGVAATLAEQIPNSKLGGLSGLLDLLAGNNKNASGSQ